MIGRKKFNLLPAAGRHLSPVGASLNWAGRAGARAGRADTIGAT